jgi:hypothetical protein
MKHNVMRPSGSEGQEYWEDIDQIFAVIQGLKVFVMTHNVMRLNRRLNQRKPKILWKPSIERPLRFKILVKMLFARIDGSIHESYRFMGILRDTTLNQISNSP